MKCVYETDLIPVKLRFWFGLITFGMGLTIPEHEMKLCKELDKPAWEALALTNDLYSWEKERDDAAKAGESLVVNAIWVLMQEYSISEPEAKDLCQQKIKESVARAVQIANDTRTRTDLSLDLRKYTDAITYSVSGNLVWSIYCPRYHPEQVDRNDIFLSDYMHKESLSQQVPLMHPPQLTRSDINSYRQVGDLTLWWLEMIYAFRKCQERLFCHLPRGRIDVLDGMVTILQSSRPTTTTTTTLEGA